MPRRNLRASLWDCYVRHERERYQSLRRDKLKQAAALGRWRRWEKDKAVLDQLPVVKRIARTESRKFASHLDLRDLIQQGMVGLMEASNRYMPGRGGGFAQFAYFRIRGAIIDANKRKAYREEMNWSLDRQMGHPEKDGIFRKPPTFAESLIASESSAEERLIERERRARLAETYAGLARADAELLAAWAQGRPMREQCAISGMSQNYTRDRVAQLLARIRARIGAAA